MKPALCARMIKDRSTVALWSRRMGGSVHAQTVYTWPDLARILSVVILGWYHFGSGEESTDFFLLHF